MITSTHRAKPSAQRLHIVKSLITAIALIVALIGATAFTSGPEKKIDATPSSSLTEVLFTSGPEAVIDAIAGPDATESLERATSALIAPVLNIFNRSSETNVPCSPPQLKQ